MPTSDPVPRRDVPDDRQGQRHDFSISLARPLAQVPNSPIFIVLDAGITFGTAAEAAIYRGAMGALVPAVVVESAMTPTSWRPCGSAPGT